MKKFLADLIRRLTSRKFLLTVAACVTFYLNKQYTEFAATVLAYVGFEGTADALTRYAGQKVIKAKVDNATQLSELYSDDLSPSKDIVPGL